MRAIKFILVSCFSFLLTYAFASVSNYARLVNTLIGTKGVGLASGYLFPGATYPHGMVQFTPSYFSKQSGFVINQNSGAGCEHMGNFPTFPIKGEMKVSPNMIRDAHIDVSNEKGHAGYYYANVQNDIKAELTVTERTGMAQYTWPQEVDQGTVIIGAGIAATNINNACVVIKGKNSCEGYADGGYFCGIRTPYKVYFYAKFDADAIETGTWKGSRIYRNNDFAEGKYSGVYFTFSTKLHRTVHYKIGISYVSVENARRNLMVENSGWNFPFICNQTEQKWNKYLGMIEAKGGSNARTEQFYTHLYRSFIHPSVFSDVNGDYIGADFKVHNSNHKHYSMFSNWDTYRTQIQLLSVLEPEVTSDIVLSLKDFAIQSGGSFPRWVLANIETGIMQGDPTSILVSDAWAFGARNYDPIPLFQIMCEGAERPGSKSQNVETRPGLKQYLKNGFYNASIQLEYTSSDFAIGQFALHAVGNKFASRRYFCRARSWKNLYNPKTGWLQSRNEDGSWKSLSEDFREATYKTYFWMVPYDLNGLMDIIGGKKEAQERLDEYFKRLDAGYNDPWFASGNEPGFGVPWVYNWAGQPWKAQKVINRILNEEYTDRINGLPGNDDLGAMGAWYVWASIGMYPEIPGVAGFALNTPIFPSIVIHTKGKDIMIKGGSEKKIYIHKLLLNGRICNTSWVSWDNLQDGAVLKYTVSSKPDYKWGTMTNLPSYK